MAPPTLITLIPSIMNFKKIRDYRTTKLEVDPEGFNVKTTGEDDYREVKIDLPDSWVRGFLQVSASMALPAAKLRLDPQDIFMFCQIMRQRKDTAGTRAIQFHLTPGQPARVVFEPWNIEILCDRSTYFGDTKQTIRVWGRRRLHILERLVPVAKHFDLYLMGQGLPYFFVADLHGMQFTLGLSGWSSNNSLTEPTLLSWPHAEMSMTTQKKECLKLLSEDGH